MVIPGKRRNSYHFLGGNCGLGFRGFKLMDINSSLFFRLDD